MITRTAQLIAAASFLLLSGCPASNETGRPVPQQSVPADNEQEAATSPSTVTSTETPAPQPAEDLDAIRQQLRDSLPAAIGLPAEEVDSFLGEAILEERAPRPSDFGKTCQAPSFIIMMLPIHISELYQAHSEELDFAIAMVRYSEVADELRRSRDAGYYSMIQPDRITDFTCDVTGNEATGTAAFEVPNLYYGKIHYRAVRDDSSGEASWRFTEFRFPIHDWTFRLARGETKWTWTTAVGDVDLEGGTPPPRHRLTGRLLQDGKSAPGAKLTFHHHVERFSGTARATTEDDGSFSLELPIGSYTVIKRGIDGVVLNKDSQGNPLEIKEGANRWELDGQQGTRLGL